MDAEKIADKAKNEVIFHFPADFKIPEAFHQPVSLPAMIKLDSPFPPIPRNSAISRSNLVSGSSKAKRKKYVVSFAPIPLCRASEKLRMAVSHGAENQVLEFLNSGVEVNSADTKGRTPLHIAATRTNVSIASLLINHGADVNAADANGNTALHLAACTNNIKMVTLLLDAGTDISRKDGSGR
eukprot:Sdes_comp19908_c0_seq3m12318